ncbi:MAG TPA: metallophosphoesterase family protein [Solirubrobacteraceae bacterium]|nr:metallophosphoesterase family protein [Solirubrobacteraceae bacterium]
MLIAILADTHLPRGRRRLPDQCLERLRSAELILHAGDISTSSVLDELSALGPPVVAVHGNVDEGALVKRLPAQLEVEVDRVRLAMTHDAGAARGRLARLRKRFPRAHAVVFGHSHIPLHAAEDGFQIFNPGSPTDRRRQPQRSMGIAHVERGAIEFELVALGP